jgi:superfamily I DNA/RNA helicase
MTTFDITAALPSGTTLIEASAGTGKTWTLSALVVRYVAEGGLPLGELLVVTFSRAASQELRERVRARLEESLTALERDEETDDVLIRHLRDCPPEDLELRLGRLRTAVADFDTATIATIHQFCHYVLKSLGVAGDSDPHATLAEDLSELRSDAVDDLYLAGHSAPGADRLTYDQAVKDARIALDNPGARLSPEQAEGLLGTRLAFVDRVRTEVARRKRRAALLAYDDLLTQLADALGPGDSPARRRMQDRWSVVLVDEFQDTDPVQWQVFSQAFGGSDKTLVLIGDPKQAIYGFRGGDIHTYLRAADTATSRMSLPTNFRSDAPLVDALRTMLANVQLSPGITARPITAHRSTHRLQGAPDNSAIRVRALIGRTLPVRDARAQVCADAADDIARLLGSGATFDGSPVQPQHLAVLAFRNQDLLSIREALRAKGVPSVLVSSESVLRTTAADWWLQVLMALERPHRPERLRLAALTPFLGWSARQLDERGEDVEEAVRRLRRSPDRAVVGADVGDGARRPDRAVRLDRPRIRRAQRAGRIAERGDTLGRALGDERLLGDEGTAPRPLLERVVADELRALAPAHAQLARPTHGGPLVGGDDADEVGDADDANSGQRSDRRLVDRLDLGADRGRTDDAAVQHAGNGEVVDVQVSPRDLGGNVGARQRLADDRVARRRLQRRLRIHLDVEAATAEQRGERDAAAVGCAHLAFAERELARRPLQALGREREESFARRRGRLPQLDAAAHDASAARGRPLVRRQRGIALDQLDAVDAELELLADHLPHRDAVAGAEVDLARMDDDRAVGANGEERVDRVERQRARSDGLRLRARERRREREAHDERAGLEQAAPCQRDGDERTIGERGHGHPLLVASAARSTARRTRSCEPQRQRLPASACCACSRVGLGSRFSSATALITMPLVQ